MCSNEHMYDYAGVGGKWPRSNPACGRVGSILSDAGAITSSSVVSSESIPEIESHFGDDWGLLDSRAADGEFPLMQDGTAVEELIIDSESESTIIIGS